MGSTVRGGQPLSAAWGQHCGGGQPDTAAGLKVYCVQEEKYDKAEANRDGFKIR